MNQEEIVSAAVQADIGLGEGTGYAGILQIKGYSGMDSVEILNELNAARLLLKQTFAELAGPLPMTDMGSDKIVILFFSSTADGGPAGKEDGMELLMDQWVQRVFEEYRISVQGGFGEYFSSVTEVSQSFEQARQALEYAVYTNRKGVMRHQEVQIENTTYYYPLETEQRLISTIRAGELAEAERIIDATFAQNLGPRELSMEMKHQLIGEMKGTFLKLLDQKIFMESPLGESIKRQIIDIDTSSPIESIQAEFLELTGELCGFITNKKKDAHTQIIKQMYQYTAEMYADTELTLYRVAEHVERPEKYISQLFKEVTGVNYSDHLIKVRMDEAAILLRESRYTVDEIAARVGYNSSHSFRRAFKRLTGISPSTYRQSHGE